MFMLPEGTMISAFIGGAISKVINDGVDYTKPTIRSVLNDKNNRNYSTKIYRIIEKSLNIITDNAYKNSDDLYDAIEKIFNEFKKHNNTLESVKCGLNVLGADVSDQTCENFLEKFYEEIRRDDDLYKAVIMDLEQKDIKINQEGFRKINEKLDNLTEIVSRENENKINIQKREPVKSRTQEYADKWNGNMFLNDFDEWDENAGVNVKLSDVYIDEHLPHFTWGSNVSESTNLRSFLSKYFYEKRENKMLLILGQPGIGKSTLITWITANFIDRVDDILVYKFASDLGDIDWQNGNISEIIIETLGLTYSGLYGKTLIFDGFDEVNVGENRREILDKIYWNLIKGMFVEKLSIIITCRENYIRDYRKIKGQYIVLKPWDERQIKSFYTIFRRSTNGNVLSNEIENILKKPEILGIPLILYMVLALNISIDKDVSIVNIYDKIFSLNDNSIYDRCIYGEPHRIGKIKKQIHQVSRDIAIWMFENNSEKAYIPQQEYQKICNNISQKQQKMDEDFLIGNFFKLVKHCEGVESEDLYFVHRSIYEYFVAETIFSAINNAVNKSKEYLACVFGSLLKKTRLSSEICDFLNEKIKNDGLNDIFSKVNEIFQLMLQDGMTYYVDKCYKNAMDCEMNIFSNMLEIMHFWEKDYYVFDDKITDYIMYNKSKGLNLRKLDLERSHLYNVNLNGANLNGANLNGAHLNGAHLNGAYLNRIHLNGASLIRADLSGASLCEAHLDGADLRGAYLSGVHLRGAYLRGTYLKGVDLREVDLNGIDLSEAILKYSIINEDQIDYLQNCNLQEIRIYREKMEDYISYEEYSEKRQIHNGG